MSDLFNFNCLFIVYLYRQKNIFSNVPLKPAETGTIKGVEAPSTPLNEKFSPSGIKLEAKFEDLYEKIVGINTLKVFSLLERFQNAA